jgi:hypothetical protein
MHPFPHQFLLPVAACMLTAACGGRGKTSGPQAPTLTPKCELEGNATPLTVEWSASRRSQLEGRMAQGTVIVRATGCEITVLSQCSLKLPYKYAGLTPKTETVTIRDDNELFANLPVGAATLRGKLASSGALNVTMTLVGRMATEPGRLHEDMLQGGCEGATHVLTGATVGAFEFSSGASVGQEGGGQVLGIGAGASHRSSKDTISRDGDQGACSAGKAGDDRPPGGCGAIVRIELSPLERALDMAAAKQAILDAQRIAAECGRVSPIRAPVVGGGAPLAIHPDGTIELVHPYPQEGNPPIEKCIREGFETKRIPRFSGKTACFIVGWQMPECFWPNRTIPACDSYTPPPFDLGSMRKTCAEIKCTSCGDAP